MSKLQVIIEGVDKASKVVKAVGNSIGDLGSASNRTLKSLAPLNSLLKTGLKVAAAGAAAAVIGLGAGLASSVMDAADMEQHVADIAAVMGVAADKVGPLKDLINELGIDPKLKVDATGAADAIEMLAKNGLSMSDILDGAARNTVLLSNATGADMAGAADIATDAMALFNIKASDMKDAVDGIVGVTVNSKFGIEDYALALGTGAKGAVAAGMGFDQFNEILTATASNFTSGMTAGTGITAMLLGLAPRTDKAADLMKELGIITAEAGNRFFDANGQIKSNAELAEIMRETLGKLAPEQRMLAVNTLFGRDAMAAVNGMIGTTTESWGEYSTALAKTDAEQQAATRMDTLRGSMEILTGIFDSLKLQIGDKFLPIFKKFVDKITEYLSNAGPGIVAWAGDMATKLGALIDRYMPIFLAKVDEWIANGPKLVEQIKGAATQVGAFLINVAAVIGPVISWVTQSGNLKTILYALAGVMVVNALASVISLVAGVWSAVAAVGAFVIALAPVTLIVGAIALAIYGLYVAWQNNFLGIRDITAAVWAKLQEWFGNIVDWFRNFPEHLTEFGNSLAEKAKWVISRLGEGIGWARDTVANAWNGIKDWLQRARDEWAPVFGQSLYNFGHDALIRIGDGFNNVRDAAKGALQSAIDWIAQGREGKLGPLQQALFDGGKLAVQRLGEGFNNMREAVKGQLEQVLNDAKERGWSYATGAFAGRMYDGARASMLRFVAGFSESHLPDDFRRAIEAVAPAFDGWIDGFKTHVYGPAKDIVQRMIDGFNDIDIGGKFNDAIYSTVGIFNDFVDDVSRHFFETMKSVGGRLVDGLAEGIRAAWSRLQDALNWIASIAPQWIKDALGIHSPSTVFKVIGEWIPPGLAEGILATADEPLQALAGVAQSMMNGVAELAAQPAQALAGSTDNNGLSAGSTTFNNQRTNNFNVTLPGRDRGASISQQTKGLVEQLVAIYA